MAKENNIKPFASCIPKEYGFNGESSNKLFYPNRLLGDLTNCNTFISEVNCLLENPFAEISTYCWLREQNF